MIFNGKDCISSIFIKEKRLCVPNYFMHELLIRKAHEHGLIGHFRVAKTLDVLYEYFYWSKMKRYMQRIYVKCIIYRQAKFKVLPYYLSTPVHVPKEPWVDI